MGTEFVKVIKVYEDVVLPEYKYKDDSGMDVHAYFTPDFIRQHALNDKNDTYVLLPLCRVLIPTGIKTALPTNTEIQVRSRSGLALKNGIFVLNSPGTVDEGYRGEIGVILYNSDPNQPFYIKHGDRIAQFVFAPVLKVAWFPEKDLQPSQREAGGYGSTGVRKE